jgi:predicted metal-dependent HD superfamily phosphohydrolase
MLFEDPMAGIQLLQDGKALCTKTPCAYHAIAIHDVVFSAQKRDHSHNQAELLG